MNKQLLIAATALTVLWSVPAQASSMPRPDFGAKPYLGLGIGNGLSLSIDFPVSRELSLGGSLGAPGFLGSNFDFRLLYKLVNGGRSGLTLDLLAGLQASGPRFSTFNNFDPFVGVGLAYPFTPRLTGRLNVAVGVVSRQAFLPSGIELGYRFTPSLEGTIGANGHGDFLGLKFDF